MSRLILHRHLIALWVLLTSFFFLVSACGDSGGPVDGFRSDTDSREGFSESRGPAPTPEPRMEGDRLHGIWPEVWSQHAPGVKSWEYKVNCMGQPQSHTEPCFLSDLTAVNVTAPDGSVTELEFDFNTNEFSGEVTRRWVKYGPHDGNLPERGDYIFRYWQGDQLAYEQPVPYSSEPISYPTDVRWERRGDDLFVTWTPPAEADSQMWYKAIIWPVDDQPPTTVSQQFDWDASSGVMKDVPFIAGGEYSLNVAIYFSDGYAYSEYVYFTWE